MQIKRIMVFYILTIFSFMLLFGKLVIVNHYQADGFTELFNNQRTIVITEEMPRGEIFDRNGKLIATNTVSSNLMYIETGEKSKEELLDLADNISKEIEVSDDDIYQADLKTLWMIIYNDEVEKKLTSEDLETIDSIEDENEQALKKDSLIKENITDEDLEKMFEEYGEEKVYLMVKMNNARYSNEPIVVKEGLTEDEQYYILNHQKEIGGFYLTTDWTRDYVLGDTLKTFIGSMGEIPMDDWEYYEALGYNQNEEVGVSYLEEELEPILHGKPQKIELVIDDYGNIIDQRIIQDGKSGYDVKLTIDVELQDAVEDILEKNLMVKQTPDLNSMYAVITDPKTGEILATNGIKFDPTDDSKETIMEFSRGTFTDAYEVGSVVKPAILATAYSNGAWERNHGIYDSPMYFKDTPAKASWTNMGYITEADAITRSSNVYFWNVALAIAGESYVPNGSLNIEKDDFERLRAGLSEFGLGVSTGFDFDNENTGDVGSTDTPGLYLDLAIGQYDTYTAMQLNQYISTIANDGKRMQLQYVQSIHESGDLGQYGKTVTEVEPTLLNELTVSDDDLEYIQSLLLGPTQNPLGSGSNFIGSPYNPAGKTGTAEMYCKKDFFDCVGTYYYGTSFIGYAPYDDPEIAISVLIPNTYTDYTSRTVEADLVGEQIMDYYFEEN